MNNQDIDGFFSLLYLTDCQFGRCLIFHVPETFLTGSRGISGQYKVLFAHRMSKAQFMAYIRKWLSTGLVSQQPLSLSQSCLPLPSDNVRFRFTLKQGCEEAIAKATSFEGGAKAWGKRKEHENTRTQEDKKYIRALQPALRFQHQIDHYYFHTPYFLFPISSFPLTLLSSCQQLPYMLFTLPITLHSYISS